MLRRDVTTLQPIRRGPPARPTRVHPIHHPQIPAALSRRNIVVTRSVRHVRTTYQLFQTGLSLLKHQENPDAAHSVMGVSSLGRGIRARSRVLARGARSRFSAALELGAATAQRAE